MGFILKMAWRDSRASRRRLLLYSVSVVLGIAALVSIGSFSANIRHAIDLEAKALLGADLFVTSPSPLPGALVARLRSQGEMASEQTFSSMMGFPASGHLRLVQVHAVSGGFPFYGDFQTDPAGAGASLAAGGDVVLLEPTLLAQFRLKPGDPVRLGTKSFRVLAALGKVPGESPGVAMLAPRAYIPQASLQGTGLSGHEALERYRAMVKLAPAADADAVVRDLKARFPELRLSFETVAERKRGLGRSLTNLDAFLGLVGFVALILGGIGVASALQAHVRAKVPTVAILRCLGAGAGQAFGIYLVQGLALGIAGAVLGGALGVGVQRALPALFGGMLPVRVDFFVSWPDLLRGTGAGVVICLLFSVLPLLPIRRVPPLAALRSSAAEGAGGPDPLRLVVGAGAAAAIAGFAIWQTGAVAVGLGFASALGLGFLALAGLGVAAAWAARRLVPAGLPYVVRQGVANLHRPNNRTVLLLVSLGLATFLVLTLFLVRTTLLREIEGVDAKGRPNLIFFDIQDDQIGPLQEMAAAEGAPVEASAPIVTMRIASIRGQAAEKLLHAPGARTAGWALRREYRSTYRGTLADTEKLSAGAFTGTADPSKGPVPVSFEKGLAEELGLSIGDEVDWDVQGLPVRSVVGSLRTVEWRRLEPNFFVVFPLGVLERAPKTFLAAIHVSGPEQSAQLQRAAVDLFPNVTAIDLQLVAETLDAIFSKVAFAVQFMALFTVATALVVLAGAVLTGRHQRLREAVLLRTLGATRRQLALIQATEYAAVGILAALVGSVLAVGGNELLARFVFHVKSFAPFSQVAVAAAVSAALAVATGMLAGRGFADHPPLEVLRQEN
ncbi:MAG TPA: FtsX-like permease family protein [Opitutaceae bacterium]|jgi:putative ABC transport system permease protein